MDVSFSSNNPASSSNNLTLSSTCSVYVSSAVQDDQVQSTFGFLGFSWQDFSAAFNDTNTFQYDFYFNYKRIS